MGLNRYAKRRDQTEPAIIKGLIQCGCQVKQQDFPDLLIRRAGRYYLLEVNGITKYRKRSPEQIAFLRDWQIPIVGTLEQAMVSIGLRASGMPTSAPSTSQPPGTSTSSVDAP